MGASVRPSRGRNNRRQRHCRRQINDWCAGKLLVFGALRRVGVGGLPGPGAGVAMERQRRATGGVSTRPAPRRNRGNRRPRQGPRVTWKHGGVSPTPRVRPSRRRAGPAQVTEHIGHAHETSRVL